jgi:transposase-like protein
LEEDEPMAEAAREDRKARAGRWRGLVAAWRSSEVSQAEFCRRHAVNPNTFAWWKKKFRRGRTPSFVPVRLVAPRAAPSGEAFEVELRTGERIRVGATFNPDALRRLLAVLDAPRC